MRKSTVMCIPLLNLAHEKNGKDLAKILDPLYQGQDVNNRAMVLVKL